MEILLKLTTIGNTIGDISIFHWESWLLEEGVTKNWPLGEILFFSKFKKDLTEQEPIKTPYLNMFETWMITKTLHVQPV